MGSICTLVCSFLILLGAANVSAQVSGEASPPRSRYVSSRVSSWASSLRPAPSPRAPRGSKPLGTQLMQGDLLIADFSSTSSLGHYRADGTLVTSFFAAPATQWEGAALLRDQRIATTHRSFPNGVHIFELDGTLSTTFATPEVTGPPGDVNAFADGTLAVNDQAGDVELYLPDGTHVDTFDEPGFLRAFGGFIDHNDELWVGDNVRSELRRFARDGTLIDTLQLGFSPGDLVVLRGGRIWITDRLNNEVLLLTTNGAVLESFPVAVAGFLNTIAVARDGTLWVGGESEHLVRNYTKDGIEIGSFPLQGTGTSAVFMTVVPDVDRLATAPLPR